MADPFVAEIRIFAGNFPPNGWALCNGQIMSISQNTALFSLLGTTYGGNGTSTFALPNLQGQTPLQQGQGPGLTPRNLGEVSGEPTVTLLSNEIPAHNHFFEAGSGGKSGDVKTPTGNALSSGPQTDITYSIVATPNIQMSPLALTPAGGNLPHNNLMPYLTLNFIIALQGVFPPRS
jgi:microcystin-dependent protein